MVTIAHDPAHAVRRGAGALFSELSPHLAVAFTMKGRGLQQLTDLLSELIVRARPLALGDLVFSAPAALPDSGQPGVDAR